jgi:hypothetical protein
MILISGAVHSHINADVKHMTAFLRSPTWITTSFGAAYAGPNGSNFECKIFDPLITDSADFLQTRNNKRKTLSKIP